MADDEILIRLRLQGGRQTQSEVTAAAATIRQLGSVASTTSGSFDRFGRRSVAASIAMGAVRRAAFAATFAVSGLAAAAVKSGFSFNSGMEQSRIAFTQFLGSAQAANRELGFLFNLAARTPFDVGNIRAAAQSFLAMGFSLKETNKLLGVLGDTVSGLGLGAEGVSRIAIIFGQIRASGRLLGQDVQQLAQVGINARGIIQQQFNLTQAQMTKFMQGTLSVASGPALQAITSGLQRRFGGLARKQAGTFQGLTSTLRDFWAQMTGTLTFPAFERTERALGRIVKILPGLNATLQKNGFRAMLGDLDKAIGGNGRLVRAWDQLRTIGVGLGRIFQQIILPAFKIVFGLIGPGSKAFGVLAWTIGVVSKHTTILKFLFAGFLLYFPPLLRALGWVKDTAVKAFGAFVGVVKRAYDWVAKLVSKIERFVSLLTAPVRFFLGGGSSSPSAVQAVTAGRPPAATGVYSRPVANYFGGGVPNYVGAAAGANVTRPGGVVVGERGPELVSLPRAASVTPLAGSLTGLPEAVAAALVRALQGVAVTMDGRVVGELVIKRYGDGTAGARA